jgi:hypothetical protein
VRKLFNSVRLHAPDDFKFWILADGDVGGIGGILPAPPNVKGYWNKLALFKPGTFERGDRVLYFDLDILVRGPLDSLFSNSDPFVMARDGIYGHRCNSSLMAWTVGPESEEVWLSWNDAGRPLSRALQDSKGDQAWTEMALTRAGTPPKLWQDVCPGAVVPFYGPGPDPSQPATWTKLESPGDASVVIFHGKPRLHELDIPWVKEAWR